MQASGIRALWHRLTVYSRYLRRKLNRGRWLASAMDLPLSRGDVDRPGLVLIQVDGLSRARMEAAMARGNLPFLRRLLRREHYRLHTHYSGLPASTPAVQAEVFYGVKAAVPAFAFYNRDTGQVERMYEPDAASAVEEQVSRSAPGLLEGGSSYSNNYTGGAEFAESHFCAPTLGLREALAALKPFSVALLLVTNLMGILRLCCLLVIELLLAVWDFLRGVASGRDFVKELKFVPTRVGISVALREICVMGAKIDIHRGLPVIHMNFLGYDEQAHRRGPDSAFALWTLKGIDYAIARIWRDAARAEHRTYDVWIYSDHGQCTATPYHTVTGYTIREAVGKALGRLTPLRNPATAVRPNPGSRSVATGYHRDTTQCLCAVRHRSARVPDAAPGLSPALSLDATSDDGFHVVGLGPVGFVYFSKPLQARALVELARVLVAEHQVPAVVVRADDGGLTAYTTAGEYVLPDQVDALCGAAHPFAQYLGEDLERLCRHQRAGELTLLGWREGSRQLTFAVENGSHAGLTAEETTAFALLPADAPVSTRGKPFMRPGDLRRAALTFLGRLTGEPDTARRPLPDTGADTLRVLSYNVHSCIGTDGKLSVERVARLIAQQQPHIVALQELDVRRARTGGHDQAMQIAHLLQMSYYFHPSVHVEEEQYGNAILTHLPLQMVRADALPGHRGTRREPRGALWVTVEFNGTPIQVFNTHLGLSPAERLQQVNHLLGPEWLGKFLPGGAFANEPVILCGDFNAFASSRPLRALRSRLSDVQHILADHRPQATFHSLFPRARIDHIFIDDDLRVEAVHVPRSVLAKTASDHLPLVADLRLSATRARSAGRTRPAG